jgi:ribonucleotide reductase alpha subunit
MVTYNEALEQSLKYFNNDNLAATVYLGKYALKTPDGDILEPDPSYMHKRLAKEFARIEQKYPNPVSEERILKYLNNFKYIVPQGSPMAGIGNPFQIMSISNCFVIPSPFDSMSGIKYTAAEEAEIMKRRGGVGFDISTLRPKGMKTTNAAGTTDGIEVFMEDFSDTCRRTAQNGRRGALMLTISVHHPEIRTFINIKRDLKKVTGANISIRISNEFMRAVKNKEKVQLRFPVDEKENPKYQEYVDAAELWDEIISAAHNSAEPGLLFWDNILDYCPTTSYPEFKSISTNPCIVGSTLIAVADGRNAVTIEQLANEGKDVPVYSTNLETGEVEIKLGRNPRKTGNKKEVFKLTLNDGSVLVATPDHKILLKTLEYKQLKDLQVGDSIFPFYSYNNNGYRQVVTTKEEIESFPEMKVSSIEFMGYEDVYNITVDDNHNYHVITKQKDENCITSSGICIKNCGEITLSAYDSCRLLLVNTYSFVNNPFTKNAYFDWVLFEEVAKLAQRLMDDIVDLEIECVDRILQKIEKDPEPDHVKNIEKNLWLNIRKACVQGRRTGLGVTGIGDMVAAMGMTYGSEESIRFVEHVYRTLCLASYAESIKLAEERGPFPAFSFKLEKDNLFLKRIWDADPKLYQEYLKYGRRNIANLTTAPAGSVSICTQTTSGIEPVFLISYKRRKKINQNDEQARVDFVDNVGDKWQEYRVFHKGFVDWANVNGIDLSNVTNEKIEELIKISPYYKSTSNDVDWVAKIKMQAAAQKWIDHSISNTTNIPEDTPIEITKQIYMTGWESGCKGVTVYRENCRSGVLVSDKSEKQKNVGIIERDAPKRPAELECDVYHHTIGGEKWVIFVSLLEGKPYEIMGGLSNHINLPKRVKKGKIVKNTNSSGKSRYDFHYDYQNPEDEVIIKDIGNIFQNETNSAFSRILSLALRHGTPVQYVVEQLIKGSDKESDLFSFSKAMIRVLKNYIKDGTKPTKKKCDVCESTNLAFQQGCVTCLNCGDSKCL